MVNGSLEQDLSKAFLGAKEEIRSVVDLPETNVGPRMGEGFRFAWRTLRSAERQAGKSGVGFVLTEDEVALNNQVFEAVLKDPDLKSDAKSLADLVFGGVVAEDQLETWRQDLGDEFVPLLTAGIRLRAGEVIPAKQTAEERVEVDWEAWGWDEDRWGKKRDYADPTGKLDRVMRQMLELRRRTLLPGLSLKDHDALIEEYNNSTENVIKSVDYSIDDITLFIEEKNKILDDLGRRRQELAELELPDADLVGAGWDVTKLGEVPDLGDKLMENKLAGLIAMGKDALRKIASGDTDIRNYTREFDRAMIEARTKGRPKSNNPADVEVFELMMENFSKAVEKVRNNLYTELRNVAEQGGNSSFDAFKKFAQDWPGPPDVGKQDLRWKPESGVDGFSRWLRMWVENEALGELDGRPQAMVSLASAMSAQLDMRGMQYNMPLEAILQVVPSEFKDIKDEVLDWAKALSEDHNRDQIYQQNRGDLEKQAEDLSVMPVKGVGGKETFKKTGKDWVAEYRIGDSLDGKSFGLALRRASKIYLSMVPVQNSGGLTARQLRDKGFVVDPGIEDNAVVLKCPFPYLVADQESDTEAIRQQIVGLVSEGAGITYRTAKLAELIAWKQMQWGGVGAYLDAEMLTATEASTKLFHTSEYRYAKELKGYNWGNPLTIPFFRRLSEDYFRRARFGGVVAKDGVRREPKHLSSWITSSEEKIPYDQIPFENFPAEFDDKYYRNQHLWAVYTWGKITKGLEVDWANLTGREGWKGTPINSEFVQKIQDARRYLSYWTSSCTPEFLRDYIGPLEDGKANYIEEAYGRYRDKKISESEFTGFVADQCLKHIIWAELAAYGSRFNKEADWRRVLSGEATGSERLSLAHDVHLIEILLESKISFGSRGEHVLGRENLRPLYKDEREVRDMLRLADNINWSSFAHAVADLFADIGAMSGAYKPPHGRLFH